MREVFFYGLFMDPDVLRAQGVEAGPGQRAHVDGFALRIGARATLEPGAGSRVHGMVYALDADAVRNLYAQPGLRAYEPEGVLAWIEGSGPRPVVTFRLAQVGGERNHDYARQLQDVLARLGFAPDYVRSLDAAAETD